MRAKFRVLSVTQYDHSEDVALTALYSGTPEDNQFAEATPSGKLEMMISAAGARGYFVPGRAYYLDFSPAQEPSFGSPNPGTGS